MFRPAFMHAPQAMNPAHAALTGVNSQDLMQEAQSHPTEARRAATNRPWAFAKFDETGVNKRVALPSHTPLPDLTPHIAVEDWDDLLCAITARLRMTVGEPLAERPESQEPDTVSRVRACVLECVEALDQLHTAQKQELSRHQRLELEVFDARTALAQARAELVGIQAQERFARHLARHDSLTSLPNRSFFRERLDHVLSHAEPERQALAVLYLDLDGFKPINDAYGHSIGDELLKIVAARLNQAVRAEDMVSRLGGDEFACLLSDLSSREQLSHMACKLFDAVSAPVKIGQLTLTVRPSIGMAMCHDDGATAEDLIRNADVAMYRAKRQKSGYAFFDECAASRRRHSSGREIAK